MAQRVVRIEAQARVDGRQDEPCRSLHPLIEQGFEPAAEGNALYDGLLKQKGDLVGLLPARTGMTVGNLSRDPPLVSHKLGRVRKGKDLPND